MCVVFIVILQTWGEYEFYWLRTSSRSTRPSCTLLRNTTKATASALEYGKVLVEDSGTAAGVETLPTWAAMLSFGTLEERLSFLVPY